MFHGIKSQWLGRQTGASNGVTGRVSWERGQYHRHTVVCYSHMADVNFLVQRNSLALNCMEGGWGQGDTQVCHGDITELN